MPLDLTVADTQQFITNPNPVILEIGANDGRDSARFLETYPECELYCFECDDRAIRKWQERMADYDTPPLVEVALSDEDGRTYFYPSHGRPPVQCGKQVDDWYDSGSLLRPTGHLQYSPWVTFGEPVPVTTMRLDTWMKYGTHDAIDEIDFVWMDVQGGEAKVLRGARESIPRMRYVYLECHDCPHIGPLYEGSPREHDLRILMSGHTCLGRYGVNLLFRRRDVL